MGCRRYAEQREIKLIRVIIFTALSLASVSASADINFKYRITGDRISAPVQVFDNNGKTYIQTRDPDHPPAVLDETGNPVVYKVEAPYLVVNGIYKEFELRYGRHSTSVVNLAGMQSAQAGQNSQNKPTNSEKNVYFVSADATKKMGRASDPVPAEEVTSRLANIEAYLKNMFGNVSPPAKTQTPVSENGVVGEFKIEMNPIVNKEKISFTFDGDATSLTPAQIVALADFINKHSGEYKIVAEGHHALSRFVGIKDRMISLGIKDEIIKTEERSGNSMIVDVFLEKTN